MTIKQQGGIFGRNPTFNDVAVEGSFTLGGSALSAIGTMAGQDADSVNIDGGAIDGTTIGGTTRAAISGTTGSMNEHLRVDKSAGAQALITVKHNGVSSDFLQARDGSNTLLAVIEADGDIKNATGVYGTVSDAKLKENIADAASQWDDIKALQVRNYNLIGSDVRYIGVVAQELESAGMSGLVDEASDKDDLGNDLGTTTKSVKYSILYMKAVKALQEAMTRIEQLEQRVTDLGG